MLQNLYINSENDYYPKINNVSSERENKKSFQYMGHHLYKDLNIFMEYTGKILIGERLVLFRDRFKFCVNTKTDIRHINSCKRAEPIFWFYLCLYYTGIFKHVNPTCQK